MKLKSYLWIVVSLLTLGLVLFPAYAQQAMLPPLGFQISTLGALNVGVYDPAQTLEELQTYGNFGLGTFEGLDGEMIFLDGKVYQVKDDGIAYTPSDDIKTPFAAVTFFRGERSLNLTGQITYQELQQQLDKQLSTLNLPYAIRLQGTFPSLKVRSVPKQRSPYRPLAEVVKQQQRVFELQNVQGTLVGFRLPQYFKDVNAVGYHFHFITSDRKAGGHVLDGTFLNPIAEVVALRDWRIKLPSTTAFDQAKLE